MKHLIEKLKSEGGAIVTSDVCSEIEIAEARVTGRWHVDDDGIGFVLRYPEWLKKAMELVKQAAQRAAIFLFALLLSSCVVMHERDGEGKSATYASLGGKGAYRKGVGVVHNHEKSFRDGAVLAGTAATGYFGTVTAQATEATNQVALKEASKQAASNNALKAKAIEANAAAHGQAISAEVPGVIPATPPPAITP